MYYALPFLNSEDNKMGNVFYFEWEVNLIVFLQRLLLDTGKLGNAGKYIVSLFTLFGEEMFLIVILGFIYWCYNKYRIQHAYWYGFKCHDKKYFSKKKTIF